MLSMEEDSRGLFGIGRGVCNHHFLMHGLTMKLVVHELI
jgi:hypothetical protein